MDYSFQKTYTLLPQSPLIHFQWKQPGAALRATEVKPKLDRYIIKRYGEPIPDNWRNEQSPNALNYKLRLVADGSPEFSLLGYIGRRNADTPEKQEYVNIGCPYDIYYGNMGTNDEKRGVTVKIRMTVDCFLPELLKYIDDIIGDFFIVKNFGTMQGKGFGSYIVDGKPNDSNYICQTLTTEYQEITAGDLPLWNRAIMSMYAPGSTFKPCTALAGLESGAITPKQTRIACVSPYDVDGWKFKCLECPNGGHGYLTLDDAMAQSCNIYFMILGIRTGIDNISAMANRFGLGVKSGIDLPGEISGVMSSRENKRLTRQSVYDKTWFPSNTAQASIGQFDNCFTILQLCRYTAGIATNKLCTPYVVDKVVASDGTILYEGQQESVDIGISEDNIKAVRKAMISAAYGANYRSTIGNAFDPDEYPIKMACKTGTAETGFEDTRKEYSNGLFICYAPNDNPEVALALVVEKGKWGSSSVGIAKKIMAAYFNEPIDKTKTNNISNPILGDYLPSINARTNRR